MSRVGRQPIKIPETVKVAIEDKKVSLSGAKGSLQVSFDKEKLFLEMKDNSIFVKARSEDRKTRALHGTIRTLICNAIKGVDEGFSKTLELVGVGFRAQVEEGELFLSVGFSHPVKFKPPPGITFSVVENKITVFGADKQLVGIVADKIKKIRPPEPYKGKGIKYQGEKIRKKAGKAAKAVGVAVGGK